jgi:hypothetical protein
MKTRGRGAKQAAEHLRWAELGIKRARVEALRLDDVRDLGARLIGWSTVFEGVAAASQEIDALKLLVAEELRELLERERDVLTVEDRQAITRAESEIRKQVGKR